MRFSAYLSEAEVERTDVTLLFHNTTLEPLRSQMPWLAAHRPDLFDAYQSVHNGRVEATLRQRPLVASFVPTTPGRHLFVGLFWRHCGAPQPRAIIYADPLFEELERDFGATDVGPGQCGAAGNQTAFTFERDARLAALEGRLEIETPPGRNYARRGDTTDPLVTALYPHPINEPAMPDWRSLVITPGRLRHMPAQWGLRLAGWRGVYLIVDQSDGGRYVGAAYGEENLLGRWRQHVAGQHGVTRRLEGRQTKNFQFSILEITSPTALPEDVIALESGWKTRLQTREWGLNDN